VRAVNPTFPLSFIAQENAILYSVAASTMQANTIESILKVIEQAENARRMALSEENMKEFGYAFTAGYMTAAISEIKDIVKEAQR
jgi:hypothetical protein